MHMLMRRSPMKRTAWPRRTSIVRQTVPEVEDSQAVKAVVAIQNGAFRASVMVNRSMLSTSVAPINKTALVSSETYRRLVALLPCMWCGISGYSQHAHLNMGKGLGLKTDDRTGFPLCCTRPGVEGCHVAYDQYRLLDVGGREAHREYGLAWGQITRDTIFENGQWPRNLPLWQEGGLDAI